MVGALPLMFTGLRQQNARRGVSVASAIKLRPGVVHRKPQDRPGEIHTTQSLNGFIIPTRLSALQGSLSTCRGQESSVKLSRHRILLRNPVIAILRWDG